MNRHPSDAGLVVLGWLTRLALVLTLLGALLLDSLSVVSTHFALADQAQGAAVAAADTWARTKDTQSAYDAAAASAGTGTGTRVETDTFRVDPDGTVTVTVHRSAHTVLLARLAFARGWLDVRETVQARPTS